MNIQFTLQMPKQMGHTNFIVYFLIVCAEQQGIAPVQHKWLLQHLERTGPNTVTAALDWLEDKERQMILRVTGGWRLNKENAFQLPLTYNLSEGENHAGSDFHEIEHVFKNHSQRDSWDGGSSSSTINDLVPSYLPLLPLLDENHSQRDSLILANRAALEAAGIRGSKVLILAKLVHVTPEFIAAHVEQAKRDGVSLGAAIHRIQENWEVDVNIVRTSKNPFGHDHACRCARCKDAREKVAFRTHCPDCWKELNSECRCAQSEAE